MLWCLGVLNEEGFAYQVFFMSKHYDNDAYVADLACLEDGVGAVGAALYIFFR